MSVETFTNRSLTLELADEPSSITVYWKGKSMARDPAQFILPILKKALRRSISSDKPVVLDFKDIEYMNSSTITPIIRILDEARRGRNAVTILYQKTLKWQELSFSALEIFQTEDKRIEIRGV